MARDRLVTCQKFSRDKFGREPIARGHLPDSETRGAEGACEDLKPWRCPCRKQAGGSGGRRASSKFRFGRVRRRDDIREGRQRAIRAAWREALLCRPR